jgi:nucleotide-binding universal stress UspA family protein
MRTNEQIWKRPLLASDWSEPSRRALDATVGIERAGGKNNRHPRTGCPANQESGTGGIKRLEDESEKRLQSYCRQIDDAGIQSEPHLAMGRTVEEIIRMSRDYGATMIVMGRTGKDWFREYWLGGFSHQIAELSELPVLLIP